MKHVSARTAARSMRRCGGTTLGIVVVACLTLVIGCASPLSPKRFGAAGDDGRLLRPDASPEYDVLVGELALRDGNFQEARAAFERAIEKDPESAHLHFRLARLAAQTDDPDAAVVSAERGLELDPQDLDGRLFLGRLYRIRRDLPAIERVLRDEAGQPIAPQAALLLHQVYLERGMLNQALGAAEVVLAEDAESLAAQMAVATVYERMHRFEDAEKILRAAIENHPNQFVPYARMARMRRASGDRNGEVAIYHEVLEKHPGHYGTLVSLAETQISLSDIEAAITTFTEIAERYPQDLHVIRRLGSLEFAAGRYEESAKRLSTAFEQNPEHFEFAFSLGQVLVALKQREAATEVLLKVPTFHPLYVESRMQLASIYEETDQLDEALVVAEALRELRPERGLDYHVASLRARTGDFEGGVALLDELLQENPEDDEILYQLGMLYGTTHNDDEKALGYMRRVLELNPNNAHALNFIGYTWAERGENLEEAERLITHALEISPKDGYIADSLAWVYYMQARPLIEAGDRGEGRALLERARDQLVTAAELTGGDPVVSEHLGDVHLLMDEHAEALQYYEEAVELKPRPDEQPELMNKLERLRGEFGAPGAAVRGAPGEETDAQ